eukprot:6320921-Pyramimonas_sp.AAC.1
MSMTFQMRLWPATSCAPQMFMRPATSCTPCACMRLATPRAPWACGTRSSTCSWPCSMHLAACGLQPIHCA